ncbi:MAG: leucine-rich repeat protein [Ruminococcus sp.]|nr:leucine-rich repeat protein [Ruminococcus sp.]
MFKKIISAGLALSMVFGGAALLPEGFSVQSGIVAQAEKSGSYTYEVQSDGTAMLTGYSGYESVVLVPETIDGYAVTVLGERSYYNCNDIVEVVMPDTILKLSSHWDGPFKKCSNLEKVYLSNKIVEIPYETFYYCTSLESIDIPASVRTICSCAFMDCTGLKTLNLSNGLKTIEGSAFSGCTSLNNVVLPSSVSSIGNYAFENCKSLTKITIPKSVTSISNNAFYHVTDVVTIYCYKDSVAHQYAVNKNMKYKLLDSSKPAAASAKINMNNVNVTVKNKVYTGKAVTPAPVVKLGTKTLKAGTDYTVSYKNNKNCGKAIVTITGKGSYTGTVTKTFIIKPKKAAVKKLTSPKTKQLKVTLKKSAGSVTGYQIKYSTSKKFAGSKTKSVSTTKTSKTIKSLKKAKTYYVKVRAYKTVGGKKYYGKYSDVRKLRIK